VFVTVFIKSHVLLRPRNTKIPPAASNKQLTYRHTEQQNNRTAEQQNNRTAEQQNNRTAEQQNNRTTEQQNSRTTEQQNIRTPDYSELKIKLKTMNCAKPHSKSLALCHRSRQ
jgi:hypothetical protein